MRSALLFLHRYRQHSEEPGIQDDFNRKSLITPDNTKKQAFIFQKAYKTNILGKPE